MNDDMIATHLKNIDRRLARVEQILPALATKSELTILATREEIKTLATREEIKALATREEIKAFATREEIKAFATKEELRAAIEPLATREELRAAIEPLATREQLRAAIEPLATKEYVHRVVREEGETLRRHMTILISSIKTANWSFSLSICCSRSLPRSSPRLTMSPDPPMCSSVWRR